MAKKIHDTLDKIMDKETKYFIYEMLGFCLVVLIVYFYYR